MKKLFSLLIVALVSSQMWAATYYLTAKIASSCAGMGTVSISSSSGFGTSDVQTSTTMSTNVLHVYAKANTGYKFLGWSKTDAKGTYLSTASYGPTVCDRDKAAGTVAEYAIKASNMGSAYCYVINSSSKQYAVYAVFEAVGGGSTSASTTTAQSYTATPGANARVRVGTSVEGIVPSTSDAVDLGGTVLWATKDKGSNYTTSAGTKYSWADASAMTATDLGGPGWRLPDYDSDVKTVTGGLAKGSLAQYVYNSGETGFTSASIRFYGKWYWEKYSTLNYRYFTVDYSNNTITALTTGNSSSTLYVRPVFDLNSVNVYKLTILLVKDGVTTANVYYCAKGQVVNITPATVSGYNSSWTSGVSGTGTKTFTVTSNTTATITYAEITQNYELDWDANGGELSGTYTAAGDVSGGASITAPTATRTGYTFNGWNPDFTGKMPSDNVTYTAQWTANTNTSYTVKHYKQNLALNGYDLADTDNLTGTTATNVTPDVKSYEGFTAPATQTVSILADGSRVVEYNYTRNKYTVTVESNNTGYGTVDVASVANVPYGTVIATSTNTVNINGTTVTATPSTADAQYTYAFTNWTNGTATVTGALTVTANFSRTVNKYTINFYMNKTDKANSVAPIATYTEDYGKENLIFPSDDVIDILEEGDAAHGYKDVVWRNVLNDELASTTVTGDADYYVGSYTTTNKCTLTIGNTGEHGTVSLIADGYPAYEGITGGIYTYTQGTGIIVTATPEAGWHFAGWSDDAEEEAERFIEISASITLTPTFEQNETLVLKDRWNESDCKSAIEAKMNKTLTVILKGDDDNNRVFEAGQWSTLSVPFNYNMKKGDDLYGEVYGFSRVELSNSGISVSIEFIRTYNIEANVPYLVIPRKTTTNPVFDGVQGLVTPAEITKTSDNQVYFVSSLWKQVLDGAGGSDDPEVKNRVFYVGSNSTLRFARTATNGGTTLYGNRAFFRKDASAPAPRRVTIVLDGVEVEKEIAEDGSLEDVQNVRKYMENGRLVIECNGVRMDATGKKIN